MKLDNYHKIIKNTSPELKKRVKEMMDRLDDDYDIHVPLQ